MHSTPKFGVRFADPVGEMSAKWALTFPQGIRGEVFEGQDWLGKSIWDPTFSSSIRRRCIDRLNVGVQDRDQRFVLFIAG